MDGRNYWVMAPVLPIDGGYLSVRLKPSSAFFGLIPGLYASLLEVEAAAGTEGGAWRTGMAAAGEALGTALAAHGFPSYDHFMYAALAAEMAGHRARSRAVAADDETRGGRLGRLAFSTTAATLQVEMAGFFLRELIASEGAGSETALAASRTRLDVATLMTSSRAGVERLLAALPRVEQPFGRRPLDPPRRNADDNPEESSRPLPCAPSPGAWREPDSEP
ncbi:MAG: hypothetical protein AB7H88_16720 [Vicinamibacterales bacterium]